MNNLDKINILREKGTCAALTIEDANDINKLLSEKGIRFVMRYIPSSCGCVWLFSNEIKGV